MKRLILLIAIFGWLVTLLSGQTLEEIEQYIQQDIFPQYHYCQRNPLENIQLKFDGQTLILKNYYSAKHSSRDGECSEQAQACKKDILEKYPRLNIRLVEGKEANFFNTATALHCFLLIYFENETLLVDPTFHRLARLKTVPIKTNFELPDYAVIYRIDKLRPNSFRYINQDAELTPDFYLPIFFINDTLISFGLNNYYGKLILDLNLQIGATGATEKCSLEYYKIQTFAKAHPDFQARLDILKKINAEILELQK